MFNMFKTQSPAEKLRENKRMLDRSIRELDRERATVENQVKKTMAEMKKLAKAGQDVQPGVGPPLTVPCRMSSR